MVFLMRMVVMVFMRMVMRMIVVMMFVGMFMAFVRVRVDVRMREMDFKLHAGDGGFLPARNVQMPAVELEFF